jgi:hypothetical protein
MTALIRIDRSWAELDGRGRSRSVKFCSRCGQPAANGPEETGPLARARVCQECGMGLLLSCVYEAVPGVGACFAIVNSDLMLSAVSEAGERVFGLEGDAIGTHLLELLSSPLGDDSLARTVAQAALRPREPAVLPVRAVGGQRRIGTMAARVSTCGPPRAALVTVEPSEFGHR